MSQGYARALIKDFANNKQNEVVFIEIQNAQVPKDSIAAKLLQKSIYFTLDEVKAVSTIEKTQKTTNDPRSRKAEALKRRTEMEELMSETIQKLPKEDEPKAKDPTVLQQE